MEIVIERESVCMEDCYLASQTITYSFNDKATYMDLFKRLKRDRFFPSTSNNNVVWVLANEEIDCIFSYFPKTGKFSAGLVEKSLKNICIGSNTLCLKFFSSPQKWKECIYHLYNNNEYILWKEGWREEIKYCDFLMKP